MNQDAYRIQPKGFFNASQASSFRAEIQKAIEASAAMVVLDCQDINQIDSSGLGELILAYKSLQKIDAKLILCSINEQVEILLSMTGTNEIFEAYRTPFSPPSQTEDAGE